MIIGFLKTIKISHAFHKSPTEQNQNKHFENVDSFSKKSIMGKRSHCLGKTRKIKEIVMSYLIKDQKNRKKNKNTRKS